MENGNKEKEKGEWESGKWKTIGTKSGCCCFPLCHFVFEDKTQSSVKGKQREKILFINFVGIENILKLSFGQKVHCQLISQPSESWNRRTLRALFHFIIEGIYCCPFWACTGMRWLEFCWPTKTKLTEIFIKLWQNKFNNGKLVYPLDRMQLFQ